MLSPALEPASSESHALVVSHAPPDFEPNSSAGESDDETDPLHGAAPEPGAWVQVKASHSQYPGSVGIVLRTSHDLASQWTCVLYPRNVETDVHPGELQVVAGEIAAALVVDGFIASGEAELTFPPELTDLSRSQVHGAAKKKQLESTSAGGKRERERRITIRHGEKTEGQAVVEPGTTRHDLGLTPFKTLCELLEALEAIKDLDSTGAPMKYNTLKRKRKAEAFWRHPLQRPLASGTNLHAVLRLLMPHHDLRRHAEMTGLHSISARRTYDGGHFLHRYGASSAQLAAWSAEACGLGERKAQSWGGHWQLEEAEAAESADALGPTGDLSLAVQVRNHLFLLSCNRLLRMQPPSSAASGVQRLWAKRVDEDRRPTLTVSRVNKALDVMVGSGKKHAFTSVASACTELEVKWLLRILQRDLCIGKRPNMPVPHKGEYVRRGSFTPFRREVD
jgi:hypothetical protein